MTHSENIRQLPEYIALTNARKKILWPLSIAIVTAYFALILTIAFAPTSLAASATGGTTSIGILLGLGIILVCFVLTGIYVYYANNVIEPLTKKIAEKAGAL